MLRLVTIKDYQPKHVRKAVQQLRHTFADVFSVSYTRQLHKHLAPALNNNEYKAAEEVRLSANPVLSGFSDLLCKFFKRPLTDYQDPAAIQAEFDKIYRGVGFDDDAAFLLAFHDYVATPDYSAEAHFERIRSRLSDSDCNEVTDYFATLKQLKRQLIKVDFLAIVDHTQTMRGFAIYHVFREEYQPTLTPEEKLVGTDTKTAETSTTQTRQILHVRQAAMRQQGLGYAGVMASYFADHFPKAIYEANQRRANNVVMKQALVDINILNMITAVLGYNNQYYLGLISKTAFLPAYLSHQLHKPQATYPRFGLYHNDDSEIRPFFRPMQLQRDTLADDNVLPDQRHYLKSPPLF